MTRKTIVMLNRAETTRDPRVRRIAASLASLGHRVVVVGPAREVRRPSEHIGGFDLVRVECKRATMHADLARIEKLCPAALAIIRACDPRVLELGPSATRRFALRAHRRLERELARAREGRLVAPIAAARSALALVEPTMRAWRAILGIQSLIAENVRLYDAARSFHPDVIHANDLDTLVAGFMIKTERDVPLVYDAHEIYAEQFGPADRDPTWHHFYSELERKLLPATDGRITVCDSLGEFFVRHRDAKPFETIRNVPSIAMLPDERILARRNAPRRILYHGNYFKHRGLDEVIRAARQVDDARFVFRGFGPHEAVLRALAESEGVMDRVRFEPPVAVTELVATASACDVGLCPFVEASLNTRYALPNKFFEYTMAGLALAISNLIEMRRVLDAEGLGVAFHSLEPDVLAADLRTLLGDEDKLDEYRCNAYRAAKTSFHWEAEQERLRAYYRTFLGG